MEKGSFFFRRIKELLSDKQVWTKIKSEQQNPREFFRRFLLPLAVIPALVQFLQLLTRQVAFRGEMVHLSIGLALLFSLFSYWLFLLEIRLSAALFRWLLKGRLSEVQALQLFGYAAVPSALASVFTLRAAREMRIPMGVVFLLFDFYMVHQGLRTFMASDQKGFWLCFSVSVLLCIFSRILVSLAGGLFFSALLYLTPGLLPGGG